MKVPAGFEVAAARCGIKTARNDIAIVTMADPCAAAGVFTRNAARAAAVELSARALPSAHARALIMSSGIANALTGNAGMEAAETLRAAVATRLQLAPTEVLMATTGVLGVQLPVEKMVDSLDDLLSERTTQVLGAAEAIMTTDTFAKLAERELELGAGRVRLVGFAKGSGMVAPSLATVIGVIMTDARLDSTALANVLARTAERTFGRLVIDGEMSTNDSVFALASGKSGVAPTDAREQSAFEAALESLLGELARAIATDGEGATRTIEVRVRGAQTDGVAAELAKAVVGSPLVKTAIFGADPNWGRIVSALGAKAGAMGWPLALDQTHVALQGITVFEHGEGAPTRTSTLRRRMQSPAIQIDIAVGSERGDATAWGCDLSYDYVKINADYLAVTEATEDGRVARNHALTRYSPSLKRATVVEALSYIAAFAGRVAVLSVSTTALERTSRLASFANDVHLLRSAGLVPVVTVAAIGERTASDTATRLATLISDEGSMASVTGPDDVPDHVHSARAPIPVVAAPPDATEDAHFAAAGRMASTLRAPKLIFIVDREGLAIDDETPSELDDEALRGALDRKAVDEGMQAAARAGLEALANNVESVHFIDGRTPHALLAELFTDGGSGTLVRTRRLSSTHFPTTNRTTPED